MAFILFTRLKVRPMTSRLSEPVVDALLHGRASAYTAAFGRAFLSRDDFLSLHGKRFLALNWHLH